MKERKTRIFTMDELGKALKLNGVVTNVYMTFKPCNKLNVDNRGSYDSYTRSEPDNVEITYEETI